jgi:hypothetical protein
VPPEVWRKWVDPADQLLKQAYYRILGMITFHGPIAETIEAIKWLAANRRGGVLTPMHVGAVTVYKWEGVQPYEGVSMNVYVIGSSLTQNTGYLREQWWKLYLLESLARRVAA